MTPSADSAHSSAQTLYDARTSSTARRLLSARFQLNSLGGAAQLATLGTTPYWRQWASQHSDATPPAAAPEHAGLSIDDMHDIFDISPPQLRVIVTVLERLAHAERAGPTAVERTIRQTAKLLVLDDALFEVGGATISDPWEAVHPLTRRRDPCTRWPALTSHLRT